MATQVTAKIKCTAVEPTVGDDTVSVYFGADYDNNEANKEWSKYTPALNIAMVLKGGVAEHFNAGDTFDLLFVKTSE